MKLYEVLNLLGKRNSKVKIKYVENITSLSYDEITIESYISQLNYLDIYKILDSKIRKIVCHRGNFYEIFIDNCI